MRAPRAVLLVPGTLAVVLLGGTLAGAGATAAAWRHDTVLGLGQVRLATVEVDLEPGFHVDDLHLGRYVKVTPGDDHVAVTFRVTPRVSTPGTAATLTLSLPPDWQVAGHPYLHPEVAVAGVPVPATGTFQHTVHLVPEGTTWTGADGPVVTVGPGDGATVEVTLRLWRDAGGGANFVVAPTELTASLQKVREGRPVGVPATATSSVPGFYKGQAPLRTSGTGAPDAPAGALPAGPPAAGDDVPSLTDDAPPLRDDALPLADDAPPADDTPSPDRAGARHHGSAS
jgi:hypothetical protein